MFEFLDNSVVVSWTQEMLELSQHVFVLSWIKLHVLLALELLDLEEQLLEILGARDDIDVNGQECLDGLKALGVLAHGTVVNRVPLVLILLGEDLLIPIVDILGILLEQVVNSNVEVFMPLDGFCIMEYVLREVAMLDIHVFESVSIFLSKKLIEEDFLQVHPLNIE